MTNKKLRKINDSIMNLDSWIHLDNRTVHRIKRHAEIVAKQYAAYELQRFAQHLKDQGFSPNQAYSNHIQDCFITFDIKE